MADRIVRNPIYVAFIFVLAGVALAVGSDWMIVTGRGYAIVLHFCVVKREEAYLEARFGEMYREYKARVPDMGGSGDSTKEHHALLTPRWTERLGVNL